MHAIEHTYVSLLADVAQKSGFSEIRGSYEGLQWCLIEAPKLEKLVLETIETGVKLDLDLFPTWLRRLAAASLLDAVQLRYLRQLLLFCYKAQITHDQQKTEKTYQGFLDTNLIVGNFGRSLSRLSPSLLNDARRHCQSVLHRFRGKEIKPSHGPGAVTTDKYQWRHIYSTIESVYPFSDWFSLYYNEDHLAAWDRAEHKDIISAKVVAVPKDSRGPRLICVHPAESIWIQQGVRRELERAISLVRDQNGPWPRGYVRFDDQSVNAKIALTSSRSRRYATIDMKEASDRISEPLVQVLFGTKYKYFGCCRAQEFTIPSMFGYPSMRGQVNSYAPMGNATTFPVQSLVFWSICVSALQRHGHYQPGAAFVFGDDIIVPSEMTEIIIDELESFGLLVNRSKSFWRGAFRESCGTDAFNGTNVTPLRWKTTIDAEHPTGLLSLSDLAMRLRIAGYEEAAMATYFTLRRRLRSIYGKELFITNNPDHGGIAEYILYDSAVWRNAYWHRDYQQFVHAVWRLKDYPCIRTAHDWNHVLESLLRLDRSRSTSIRFNRASPSIQEATFSRRLGLNRGWSPMR